MRKMMLIALFSSLVVSCNESMQNGGSNLGNGGGTAQSHSSLTCLSFADSAIEAYAKSNWDADNDGCVSNDEAAAVTSIPANAFAGNTSIASLDDLQQLPNLTSIGDNAFAGCTNLNNANLSTVTSIGDSAFAGCSNLSEANMPNASNVADNAFDGTRVHQSVTCPAACPNDCDANGVCNLHVVCPADCPDDCDADGVCNVHPHVVCPEQCPNDCDANGVCNLHVVCPAECPDDCDSDGVCTIRPHVVCPAECPNDCDANGVCNVHPVTCPAECPNDCDANGVCNVHPVTCPAECPDDCDANGVCNVHPVTCPAECPDDCDADGVCNLHVVCPAECPDNCYDNGVCKTDADACDTNDEFVCSGSMLRKCNDHKWKDFKDCSYGCSGGKCLYAKCKTPDAYQCREGYMSYRCDGEEWVIANGCGNLGENGCDYNTGKCFECVAGKRECRYTTESIDLYDCVGGYWQLAEDCKGNGCYSDYYGNNSKCYKIPWDTYKCSDDGTQSLHSDGYDWSVSKTCMPDLGCNAETGKCNTPEVNTEWVYCGDRPASDVIYDYYGAFYQIPLTHEEYMSYEVYSGHVYEDWVASHPGAKYGEWCAQYENRVALCRGYERAPSPMKWEYYTGGDCFLPCTEEDLGKAFTICEGYNFGGFTDTESSYLSRHNVSGDWGCPSINYWTDIASRYTCTKFGEHYVYFPTDSVNNCQCGTDPLCSLFQYNAHTWEYDACKDYYPSCPQCVNGCDLSGRCFCDLKCHGKCDENGKCLDYPCSDSCTHGCWYSVDATQCLDPWQCNCDHEHLGPSVWEYSCEYSECYDFFPDDWY